MKIDFTKFPVWGSIDKSFVVEQDVSKQLADAIYMRVPGMAAHNLAHKIYESNGEADYDDSEVAILRNSMDMYTPIFIDSLNDFLDRNENINYKNI